MAAAMAKVLRGGRSGSSSQPLIPAICRRRLQESVVPLLPHPGSSPATSAAGMSRLMHTGPWCNSMLSRGTGSKLAEQKALLLGTRGVLSQEHKLMRMEQFSGKRFMSDGPFGSGPQNLPWAALALASVISLAVSLPPILRTFSRCINRE
ncbi:uncharacterized protein LOC133886833 [Phragmites australis]|uniref:uncharacterized protein LOC133886822 n=1 Tax=Phragmites australis TaxID=29695 RepID=UPI002D772186|nr:uncharacterized protein LOC133886822 [Phragmites australis]XP_062182690.1 uncharacterized protein LOC133886833 [Phragmites australis]